MAVKNERINRRFRGVFFLLLMVINIFYSFVLFWQSSLFLGSFWQKVQKKIAKRVFVWSIWKCSFILVLSTSNFDICFYIFHYNLSKRRSMTLLRLSKYVKIKGNFVLLRNVGQIWFLVVLWLNKAMSTFCRTIFFGWFFKILSCF